MKTCSECKGIMAKKSAKTPEGVGYDYYKCRKCGEEVLNMKQLHEVAEKYRKIRIYHTKLSKWGLSIGLRIPKELVNRYGFKNNKEVVLIPEESGIRILGN
ncbi:MAG: AbrB/MazE/SpoVT family DNA-binding domain-containing protein [Nanoarchaeota archaeon]|nr:AbrB/MazE/SpoVT family DNA-binding domain-containing protein [Nanoarchaeota archaeon]